MSDSPLEPGKPKVVEGEIVGLERRPSLWRRLMARLTMTAIVGCLGLAFCLAGVVLTVTIVGAPAGLPLLLIGLALLGAALLVLLT